MKTNKGIQKFWNSLRDWSWKGRYETKAETMTCLLNATRKDKMPIGKSLIYDRYDNVIIVFCSKTYFKIQCNLLQIFCAMLIYECTIESSWSLQFIWSSFLVESSYYLHCLVVELQLINQYLCLNNSRNMSSNFQDICHPSVN